MSITMSHIYVIWYILNSFRSSNCRMTTTLPSSRNGTGGSQTDDVNIDVNGLSINNISIEIDYFNGLWFVMIFWWINAISLSYGTLPFYGPKYGFFIPHIHHGFWGVLIWMGDVVEWGMWLFDYFIGLYQSTISRTGTLMPLMSFFLFSYIEPKIWYGAPAQREICQI